MFNSLTIILHDHNLKVKREKSKSDLFYVPLHHQRHVQFHLYSPSTVVTRAKPQSLHCGIDNKHDNTFSEERKDGPAI